MRKQLSFRMVPVVSNGNGGKFRVHDSVETLARYNAERHRGIVHTPEWQAAMAELQAEYDARKATADA